MILEHIEQLRITSSFVSELETWKGRFEKLDIENMLST